jgi:hypothetical protein
MKQNAQSITQCTHKHAHTRGARGTRGRREGMFLKEEGILSADIAFLSGSPCDGVVQCSVVVVQYVVLSNSSGAVMQWVYK